MRKNLLRFCMASVMSISVFGFSYSVVGQSATTEQEEQKSGTDEAAQEERRQQMVREAYRKFEKGIQSDDEEERVKAIEEMLPKKEHLEKLFGKEDAEVLWKAFQPTFKQMKENTESFSEQFMEVAIEVDVDDIRLSGEGMYTSLLEVIPKEVYAYEIVVTYIEGGAGAGTYFVIGEEVCFIQGADAIPDYLKSLDKD